MDYLRQREAKTPPSRLFQLVFPSSVVSKHDFRKDGQEQARLMDSSSAPTPKYIISAFMEMIAMKQVITPIWAISLVARSLPLLHSAGTGEKG